MYSSHFRFLPIVWHQAPPMLRTSVGCCAPVDRRPPILLDEPNGDGATVVSSNARRIRMTEDRFQKRGISRTLKSAVGSALVITANAACAQQPAYPEKTIRLIAIAGA